MTTPQHAADALDTRQAIPRFIWLFAVALNTMMVMSGMLLLGTQLNQEGIGLRWHVDEAGTLDIEHVFKHSPAEDAGIRVADRVVAANGDEVNIEPDEVYTLPEGDSIDLTLERDGETRNVTVRRESGWITPFSIGGLVSGLPIPAIQILALILDIVFYLIFLAVSAVVFWSRSGSRVILLMAVTMLFLAANFALGFTAFYDASPTLRAIGLAHTIITTLLAVLTLLLTPHWRFEPAWTAALPLILIAVIGLNLAGMLDYAVVLYVQLAALVIAAIWLYWRYRDTPAGTDRNLMRAFLIGVAFTLTGYALVTLADYVIVPLVFAADPWAAWPYVYFWGSLAQMLLALALPYMLWNAHRRGAI